MKKFSKKKAFTLVEFAIILVLIGLLVGFGATLIGTLTKRTKYTESKEAVKKAASALKGYAIRCGCLPYLRPITEYNPYYADNFTNIIGVSGFDAQGRALLFRAPQELISSSPQVCNCTIDLCNIQTTTFSIIDKGNTKQNIAFMVVSGGLNFNIQTDLVIYHQGQNNIDDFPYDFTRPEEYDDIVEYVSLFELQQQRCNYASATGYCSSSLTVFLDNNVNSYRKSGGGCLSGNSVNLAQADYLETYGGANCNNFCGNFTYSDLASYDSDKDCQVQIQRQGSNCYVVDY